MGRILIIDDNVDTRNILFAVMENLADNIDVAPNGEEGLILAKKHLPNLILLDLMMPRISGIEVLLRLAADPTTRRIPVIIISAMASERKNLLQYAGVLKVFSKGALPLEELRDIAKQALES